MSLPTTSYTLAPDAGVAGMIADFSSPQNVVSALANEAIPFGRIVELTATSDPGSPWTVQLPQGVTLGKVLGVAVYDATHLPGGYAIGEMVPVLRRGKIWIEYTGGTQLALTALNVLHSSTIATNRGKATMTATSATTGAEIDVTTIICAGVKGVSGLVKAELNQP